MKQPCLRTTHWNLKLKDILPYLLGKPWGVLKPPHNKTEHGLKEDINCSMEEV